MSWSIQTNNISAYRIPYNSRDAQAVTELVPTSQPTSWPRVFDESVAMTTQC